MLHAWCYYARMFMNIRNTVFTNICIKNRRNRMTIQEQDVLQYLLENSINQQRDIAAGLDVSLGIANKALRALIKEGWIDENYFPTEKARALERKSRPKRAIILAAGYGMRMIPINREMPKGLIEINGEPIIEHTIRQIQEAGIREIVLVTGFMKERYEYLEDRYGVTPLYCRDYTTKNNLYTLACAAEYLEDAYIVPCDVYFYKSPFRKTELYSWYMLSTEQIEEGEIRTTRSREIVEVDPGETGNRIIGLSYLTAEDARKAKGRLGELTAERKNSALYWEAVITEKKHMTIPARLVSPADAVEINTYEQLREIEYYNPQLQNDVIDVIRKVFNVRFEEIRDITVVKKGLTNRSFLFTVHGTRYVMRIPGEGTENLVDRAAEGRVYELLKGKDICDDNVYFDSKSGYKIAKFLENSRESNHLDPADVKRCMQLIRKVHEEKLQTPAKLDLWEIVDYYESLWNGEPSIYRDYEQVKQAAMNMRPFVEAHALEAVLTHGDCNPGNFLFSPGDDGGERVSLIDWEYAAMHDPLVDLSGYTIYFPNDDPKAYADQVTDAYYPEGCAKEIRLLVYCYCALWALYTSNWCEYKMRLGVELGDFAITQYRYVKAFTRIFEEEYAAYTSEGKKGNP